MPKTAAEYQAAHRARVAAKSEAQVGALRAILAKLDGNDKPLAIAIRQLAEQGLGDKA